MKTLISIISLVTLSYSTLAFAAVDEDATPKNQYLISASFVRDGLVLSNPKVMSLDGEEAMLEQGDANGKAQLKFVVEAKSLEKYPGQVRIKFMFMNDHEGEEFKFKTRMVMKDDGREVEIPVTSSKGRQYLLKLSATRQ